MISFSEHTVNNVNGLADWGEVGSRVPQSKYRRDYCFLCGEPIRVSLNMIGSPNACSFCQPAFRGSPGVDEGERLFWIKQTLDEVEVICGYNR